MFVCEREMKIEWKDVYNVKEEEGGVGYKESKKQQLLCDISCF